MKHPGLLARGRAEGEDMIVRGKRKCCSADLTLVSCLQCKTLVS